MVIVLSLIVISFCAVKHCSSISMCVCVYPYGEVRIKAPRGAAVLGGIDEGQRPECVLQQTAGESVRPFTAQTHAHTQDLLQVPPVF